jgi:acetoin utilization deacetylase AcuC-like enzyme/ankyrin repeat protein
MWSAFNHSSKNQNQSPQFLGRVVHNMYISVQQCILPTTNHNFFSAKTLINLELHFNSGRLQASSDVHFMLPPSMHRDGPNVNEKDDDMCTPLHVAILNGQLEAVKVLLGHGARVTAKCDGCPALHMAVCVGSHPEHAAFATPAVQLLVSHGAVVLDRDDGGRTPLHWAAASGLVNVAKALLDAAMTFSSQQEMVVGDDGVPRPAEQLPTLPEFQDKQGNTALHLAARNGHAAMVQLLLCQTEGPSSASCIKQRNKSGLNVLHLAALGGDIESIKLILAAYPAVAVAATRQGCTAAELAAKRGHLDAVPILQQQKGTSSEEQKPSGTPTAGHHKSKHTLILAPPECLNHHTAPWPIVRGESPPPENVNRLTVLIKPGTGILRTCDFENALRWDERPRRAPMGDILRVHNWAYVRKIQSICQGIEDDPSEVGHLDPDTAISHRTFSAALAAAGAVTHAVDEVVTGRARNVFCAVRPPGHHAGPSGVVTCAKDPNGSHGFCLFNNVAIGAAYAMTVHRHAGIKRVALLDFDVHHGNGTEACVANTAPSLAKYAFTTPYGEGVQQFPVYRPWHDIDDKDNIFFASVQGYGPKAPGYMDAYVYPGSGATCDTKGMLSREVEELADEDDDGGGEGAIRIDDLDDNNNNNTTSTGLQKQQHPNNSINGDSNNQTIEEDPDHEFVYSGGEMPRTEGPRIIDVGIPGPGSRVALWRRSWRDKILPALVKFDPDIIFVSAGFDAHKKDDINFAYIGVQEKDYEWLTDQIVQVANRCCQGRVVSVLEGGYKIQGQVVSAFARSVAAHVKAMAEPNGQEWDPRDAKWEREHEKQLRAEAEAKRQAAAEAALAARLAAAAEAAAAAAVNAMETGGDVADEEIPLVPGGDAVDMLGGSPPPINIASPNLDVAAAPIDGGEEEEDGTRRKRRRGTVDYVALNKKIEDEQKAAAGPGPE